MHKPSPAEQLCLAHDWSASLLGVPDGWPAELQAAARTVFNSLLPMFVAWGPRLEVIYNDAFVELLGHKHPGAMGRPHLEIWAEARDGLEPYVERVLGGEPVLVKDVAFDILRGGAAQKVSVTFSYTPLGVRTGAVDGFLCVCVETTDAVRMWELQTQQRSRLENLIAQSPGFLAVLRGPDHVFELVNEEYRQLVGFRDVVGKTAAEALPEVVDQGFISLLDGVLKTGEPFMAKDIPIMLQRATDAPLSQAYVDFVYQPLRGVVGEVDGILVQGHEVTEQRAAREELLAFSNSVPGIAWVAGPDGSLGRFNSQWDAYTGTSGASAQGRGWLDQVHPDDLARAGATWEAARGGSEPWQVEYRLRGRDGTYRWFLARAVPRLDPAGKVMMWFGTTTDIEDMRLASQKLLAADRQKDEFLATLAHELRNPLAPIRFAVDILSASTSSPQARAQSLEVISRQVGQMAYLLDDLIDVARITEQRLALRKEPTSVRGALDAAVEAARPLIDRKGHELVIDVEKDMPEVLADPVRLVQIFTNLLTNAAKYTDPGGWIRVEARSIGRNCEVRVTDTGIGLAPGSSASLFERFSKEPAALDRAEGGLGIGLALVKGLVELHGGSISARSPGLGLGSVFKIAVPLHLEPALPREPEHETREIGPVAAKVVLLADDNADAVDVMAELIRLGGHVVHVARDGEQAVELAAQFTPEVAILDIGMPKLNGYEVARRIRDAPATSKCLLIAATGWGQENDRRQAFDAGFDLHLTKPLDPTALFNLIERSATIKPAIEGDEGRAGAASGIAVQTGPANI